MVENNQIQESIHFFEKYKQFLKSINEAERESFLKNDLFIKNAIKYLDATELSFFFFNNCSRFNQDLLEQLEVMKPLTLKVYNAIQESKLKTNLEAMIEIASQPGIFPGIVCYVDPAIQNDLRFISSIIANTDRIDDFYLGFSFSSSEEESKMRYNREIGKDIQMNPIFWEMLNAMLKKKNPKSELFDVEKEIEIAKKHFSQEEEMNIERTSFDFEGKSTCVSLHKGEYFENDNVYFVKFDYSSPEQGLYMLDVFHNLIQEVGSKSKRFKDGRDFIMPYLVDEFGIYTTEYSKARGIGGTSIPEDLLYEFIRRMVELDKCIIRCGDEIMKDNFSPEILDSMLHSMNNGKTK